MPAYWSDKDERQYEKILESCKKRRRGRGKTKTCKRIAAATVNKQRSREGRTLASLRGLGQARTTIPDDVYVEEYDDPDPTEDSWVRDQLPYYTDEELGFERDLFDRRYEPEYDNDDAGEVRWAGSSPYRPPSRRRGLGWGVLGVAALVPVGLILWARRG